jgi:hypothetical protein
LDPCVYSVFDSESALELNPEVVNLIPGTPVKYTQYFSTATIVTRTHLNVMFLRTLPVLLKYLKCKKGKGKAIPSQALTGPEGSRKLRLPDFKTIGT